MAESLADPPDTGWTPDRIETFRSVARSAFAGLKVDPPLSMIEWADKEFWLSDESSDIPGRWTTVHFQRGLLWFMQLESVRELDVQKCARVGYTKCLLIDIGYHATHQRRQMVLWQPTDDDAKEFAKDSIETMVRDTRAVAEALAHGDVKNKHNTLSTKQFKGATLHILGGKAARAYRRLTKDRLYYDELDGFDRDIEGEGAPTRLGDKRAANSPHKKSIRGTTPRVDGDSNIQDAIATADAIFDYRPRCLHCDELVPFGFRHLKFEERDATTVRGVCEACGGLWRQRDHFKIMESGAWVSECGIVLDDKRGIFTRDGERVASPRHCAVRIWAGVSPWVTWETIIEEHLDSLPDPLARKVFTNTVLGEHWAEEAGESVDQSDVMERAEVYDAECPVAVNYITAAVDVQQDRLELLYMGWSAGEVAWSLAYRQLPGDPSVSVSDPDSVWNRLHDQLKGRQFAKADGSTLSVGLSCIDSGYLAEQVYEFCRLDPFNYIPIKGQDSGPLQQYPKRRSRNLRVNLTPIGTHQGKTLVYSRLKVPGAVHFPRAADHDADYFAQLTSEELRKKYSAGHAKTYWWKPSHAHNEVLDLHVYNTAAVRIAIQHFGVRLDEKALTKRAAEPADTRDNSDDFIPDVGDDWLR